MKYTLLLFVSTGLLLASCGNENKPSSTDVKAAEEQVARDQAAMDSMDQIIQQQIEAVSDDSFMNAAH